MLAKRLIVCMDVKDGRVVKGTNFVGLRDAGDPVECAVRYDAEEADELVFLDITAGHEKRQTTVDLARRCAQELSIPFTIGGGVRSVADFETLLRAGADKVAINSAAVRNEQLITECARRFGVQAVVLAVDARRVQGDWHVYVDGGRTDTGRGALSWLARGAELGAGEILLTSMDQDGTGRGFDLELTRRAAEVSPVPVIASGGAGTLEHLREGFESGAAAVLAAGIFHFGNYSVRQAKQYLRDRGVLVRPPEEAAA
ncbi:MAG: imidazole glycerol phosphate synthase subunit HisF [Planctomycetaceae bacterium]|nr:Imidazole glycerol phosphate synthase subunit HisF [Planctomycetota bacterium]NUO17576.1 imidazole glycerol phosphate synthase subunit HisF [Planctomycetaceae bacterium]HRJ77142.1 imidazole glycerol phosphate synthase subunit HisF [Planctomycetota bacterium]